MKVETPDIKRIYFLLKDNWKLEYAAGQYITVFINGSSVREGKAYSLSSAPREKLMSITVKNVGGEYSNYLCGLQKGDEFTISRTYGHFTPKANRPIVAMAAGVGIGPIISILKDCANGARAHLFYSNKSHKHIPHQSDLSGTSANVTYYITAELEVSDAMVKGRIAVEDCVKAAEGAFYMICGSVQFVRDMWQGLTEHGVAAENIVTETFFES